MRILVDTEQVRDVGHQLRTSSDQFQDLQSALHGAINSLDTWAWDGRSRADAEPMLSEIYPLGNNLTQEMDRLGQMLRVVADRFESEDASAAGTVGDLPWVNWEARVNADIPFLAPLLNPVIPSYGQEKFFENQWKSWSETERLFFLQSVYAGLATELGLTPIRVRTEDLEDPEGKDARGYFSNRAREIVLDIDNVRGNDATEVLQTLIHETRHQYQRQLADQFRAEGATMTVPDGMTLDQIRSWSRNFDNYISSDDDFEAYRAQPIEQDARDFAASYYPEALPEPKNLKEALLYWFG